MRGARLLWFVLPFLWATATAQDPLAGLRRVEWSREEVGVGVHLSRREFTELFGAPQSVAVLELEAGVRVDVAAASERTRTSAIAAASGAMGAVNGGFFDVGKGTPIGLLRVDGDLVSAATEGQGAFGVDEKGRVHVAAVPAGDWKGMVDALGAGPILVRDRRVVDHGARQRAIRHPRTALGVRADGSTVLVVVDGRNERAAGMSFEELATVLISLGCEDGVNLDGGGSSTMWLQGSGIVNHPCDNKRFDADGERTVANAVLVTAPTVLVLDEEAATFADGAFATRAGGADSWRGDFAVSGAEGPAPALWSVRAPRPGEYEVYARWPRVSGVRVGKVEIRGAGLEAMIDQRTKRGRWVLIGKVEAGDAPVEMTWRGEEGRAVVLDGVRFVECYR